MTLVQHHSLRRLPDAGYRPRRFDPRAGSFAVEFLNYAAPLTEPVETRYLVRHRLEKVDPAAPRSRVKEPLVYYVDSGAPEPVRGALLEGAGWWQEAFEKAGFVGDSCAICTASADVVSDLVVGRARAEAAALEVADVLNVLQSEIRPTRMRCVTLPVSVLGQALNGAKRA